MCGIAGLTSPELCPPGRFTAMVDALAHRGPDDRGEWADARVRLGHRRLSILDLSPAGHQPMFTEDGRVGIVFNGEIYNHMDIRRELPGTAWKSTGDTETLLHAYRRWGPDFITRCNGMFAIAIYDAPAGRLLLFRDRVGIKPLLYFEAGGALVFASELGALREHPLCPGEIDPTALRDYFLFNYIPAPATILAGVRKLEPGCILEHDIAQGRTTIRPYWSAGTFLTARRADRAPTPEDSEHLDNLLTDAVRLRTLADVPLGCFLSGGVDSSLVAALLAKVSAGPTKTFTIGFREPEFDESTHAEAVARHLGSDHHTLTATAGDVLAMVEEIPALCDEPFADASLLPTALLSRLTRGHVTVSLSGDGGDELFQGYDRYGWALRVDSAMRFVPGPARRAMAALLAHAPHYKLSMIGNALRYKSRGQLYAHVFTGWNAPFVSRLLGTHLDFGGHAIQRIAAESSGGHLVEMASYTDLHHYLPGDILSKLDRASMRHALEARVPLLDYRVVEESVSMPPSWKEWRQPAKWRLREILYRHVPRELFERPKAGFAVPLRHWLRHELRPLMEELLSAESLRAHGLFDERLVRSLIARHLGGRYNFERQLWALLVFQLWYNKAMR